MTLIAAFAKLRDPRIARRRKYPLADLLFIALCATFCGCNSFAMMEVWAKSKQQWLRTKLDLPHGVPSHDTLARLFARLDRRVFSECFVAWTQSIADRTEAEQFSIDGKTIRGSFDEATGQSALHQVSAWACENRLVLEQEAVYEKSNEITAIPALLYRLDIAGCLVSIDAMGCQTKIAEQIIEQKSDYVLALKANQGTLFAEAKRFFTASRERGWHFDEGVLARPIEHWQCQSAEKGHGRIEIRRCFVVRAESLWLTAETLSAWRGLRYVACIESERTVRGKTSVEQRYFLTSLSPAGKNPGNIALQILSAVRNHWGVENRLHWVLDVAFREDHSRIRKGNAVQNMATLRRLTQSVLQRDKTVNIGVAGKRLKAGWDNDYLLSLLTGQNQQTGQTV